MRFFWCRSAEEARRQQQQRPATQHVYGVPMPPPAPLRMRRPAGSRERHYQPIARQRAGFTRRDWALTIGLVLGATVTALVSVPAEYPTALYAAAAALLGVLGEMLRGAPPSGLGSVIEQVRAGTQAEG